MMRKIVLSLLAIVCGVYPLRCNFADDPMTDYQNYNHGYCSACGSSNCQCKASPQEEEQDQVSNEETSDQPATQEEDEEQESDDIVDITQNEEIIVCKQKSGFSLMTVGIVVLVMAIAATLVVTSGNGSH